MPTTPRSPELQLRLISRRSQPARRCSSPAMHAMQAPPPRLYFRAISRDSHKRAAGQAALRRLSSASVYIRLISQPATSSVNMPSRRRRSGGSSAASSTRLLVTPRRENTPANQISPAFAKYTGHRRLPSRPGHAPPTGWFCLFTQRAALAAARHFTHAFRHWLSMRLPEAFTEAAFSAIRLRDGCAISRHAFAEQAEFNVELFQSAFCAISQTPLHDIGFASGAVSLPQKLIRAFRQKEPQI